MSNTKEQDICHIFYEGICYDATEWKKRHPGGDEIIQNYHMKDATDVFKAFHHKNSQKYLKALPVVQPDHVPPTDSLILKWRKFRQDIEDMGLLKRQYGWYAYKITTTLLLWATAVFLCFTGNWIISALIMGVFYQQAGWLGHDIAHHCVFENRTLNNAIGYFISNILQGFSTHWWKDRHNCHHSITNVLETDPDVQNLPLFLWDVKNIKHHIKDISIEKYLIPYQHYYFLPFTPLLRLIWMIQSYRFASTLNKFSNTYIRKSYAVEYTTLLMHHIMVFALLYFTMPSISTAVTWWFISNLVGGFGIAIIVFSSHYACELYEPEDRTNKNFIELQINTTRNISKGIIIDWFAGGLNYQIEHHLFPTMPRCNLNKTSELVEQFCKENNILYQSEPLHICIKYILARLEEVAFAWRKQILKEC